MFALTRCTIRVRVPVTRRRVGERAWLEPRLSRFRKARPFPQAHNSIRPPGYNIHILPDMRSRRGTRRWPGSRPDSLWGRRHPERRPDRNNAGNSVGRRHRRGSSDSSSAHRTCQERRCSGNTASSSTFSCPNNGARSSCSASSRHQRQACPPGLSPAPCLRHQLAKRGGHPLYQRHQRTVSQAEGPPRSRARPRTGPARCAPPPR